METESFVAASPLPGIYLLDKFSEAHQDECMRMFTAALFVLAKVWTQLNIMLSLPKKKKKNSEVCVDLHGKSSKRKRRKTICNFVCMVKSICFKLTQLSLHESRCTSAATSV